MSEGREPMEKYQHDVFVSYSHKDNEFGWIKSFRRLLAFNATNGGGDKPDFFIDYETLGGTGILNRELCQHVLGSKALVVILSNNYVQSEWCQQEVKWFMDIANILHHKNLFVIKLGKIAKAVPKNIEVLQEATGFDFYDPHDLQTTTPYCWPAGFREDDSDPRFQMEIAKVAKDLAELLDTNPDRIIDSVKPPQPEVKVFLSGVSYGINPKKWAEAHVALTKAKFHVIPVATELSAALQDGAHFKSLLGQGLEAADIFVQIDDDKHELLLPDDGLSEITIKAEGEWKFAKSNSCRSILWRPPCPIDPIIDQSRKAFLDDLQENEIIAGTAQDLATKLRGTEDSGDPKKPLEICVDFRNDDRDTANVLMDALQYHLNEKNLPKSFCIKPLMEQSTGSRPEQNHRGKMATASERKKRDLETLNNADMTVFLMKTRTNDELDVKMRYLNDIFIENRLPAFTVTGRGAVAAWSGVSEPPIRFGRLHPFDWSAVPEAELRQHDCQQVKALVDLMVKQSVKSPQEPEEAG